MCITGIPVPIYQDEGELNRLRDLVRDAKPRRILEVGSLFGGTLWAWMNDSPGAQVVSVDIGVDSFDYRFEDVEGGRRMWPTWANTTGCDLTQVRADSTAAETLATVRQYGPFDFIFIDGGHTYEVALADMNNYWQMLAPGGFMAVHDIAYPDTNPVGYGVAKAWREARQQARAWTEILRPENPEGIWGIGVMWR